MDNLRHQILDLIQPVFDGDKLHLVDVELKGTRANAVLKVFADTESGISIGEITQLTREISDILEIEDVMPGQYRLEVSSPGVRRPLRATWEFRKNIGKNFRIIFRDPEDDSRRELQGTLLSVDENEIVINSQKSEISILRSSIMKARVELQW